MAEEGGPGYLDWLTIALLLMSLVFLVIITSNTYFPKSIESAAEFLRRSR